MSIVTPGAKNYIADRCRLVRGAESMLLQGLHYGPKQQQVMQLPDQFLQVRAGNAFNVFSCAATMFVKDMLVAHIRCRAHRLACPTGSPVHASIGSDDDSSDEFMEFNS